MQLSQGEVDTMTTELAPPRPSRITEQDTVDFYFTKAWQEEDPCFERLVYLYLQCRSEEPDKVEGVRQAMGEHQETCGGCFRNVFVAAEEFTEQLRKQVYFNIHELAAYEFMKFSGGDYEIENNGAGIRIRLIYPPADQDVLRGIESFTPHDKSVPGWLTIDVLTQRDFESPGRLLDVIDTQDAALVRDNADPKYAVLQWLGIAHGRGSELRFRWDGRVRKVAEGTTLHDRYGALAAKMRGLFAADRSPAQHDPGRDVSAEVLLLYDVAKSYSGRIPFSRYVKPVMKRQLVDAYRDRKPDAAHADHRGEIAAPSAATRDTNESRDAALSTSRSTENSTLMLERSSTLLEVIFSMPSMPAMRSSITWVILFSMTAADAPR
jgi:hypothetical protein